MDVTVIGGSGYSGNELIRILAQHPKVDDIIATSRQYKGLKAATLHQNLAGLYDKEYKVLDEKAVETDFIFLATPHGESMSIVPSLIEKGLKVVDLSADYRFKNPKVYEKHYKKHTSPRLCEKSVYGLPEAYRKEIKKARLVANPGCYPTSVLLGLLPLKKFGKKVDLKKVTVDSMSGTSGAGYNANQTLQNKIKENLMPYNIARHRHRPEMESILGEYFKGGVKISFTPTIVPIFRGIQSNIHVHGNVDVTLEQYKKFYAKEFFVRTTETPNVKNVSNTNYCDIGVWQDNNTSQTIIISVIDNLVKGAAGQAIQNMNLMKKFGEKTGLKEIK